MDKYQMISIKGEGTFSEVLKCKNKNDGTYWACKKMKKYYHSAEQVKDLIEIQALRDLSEHENILYLHEVILVKKTGSLNLIFELMDMNLFEFIKGQNAYLADEKIADYMIQILKAIEHMHSNHFFHRDIKPENILVRIGKGSYLYNFKKDVVKVADFGSVRRINTRQPFTEYISTRWYRAPECLLTDGFYNYHMDIWSAGCVMFELCTFRPLFPGSNEIDQIDQIHNILGTPDILVLEKFRRLSRPIRFYFRFRNGTGFARHMKNCTPDAIDLVSNLCKYDPDKRVSASKALKHPYLNGSFNVLSMETLKKMNQENEKVFEEQSENRFERKTFESESFLSKKSKEPNNNGNKEVSNPVIVNDGHTYKPRFKPKSLSKNSQNLYKYQPSKSKTNVTNMNATNMNTINVNKSETNSTIGSTFDTESHISFNSIKIKNQNIFPKSDSDTHVLPELSYFTTSMPLMTLNPNNMYNNSSSDKHKKLPSLNKLKSNPHYFRTNSQIFKHIPNTKSDIN